MGTWIIIPIRLKKSTHFRSKLPSAAIYQRTTNYHPIDTPRPVAHAHYQVWSPFLPWEPNFRPGTCPAPSAGPFSCAHFINLPPDPGRNVDFRGKAG